MLVWVLRLWFRSLEIKTGRPYRRPPILAFWHRNIFPVIAYIVMHDDPQRYVALVSASRDGQMLASVLQQFGFEVIFGSSSSGGFRSFMKLRLAIEHDKTVLITPDGPRGPAEVSKPGVVELSRSANVEIVGASVVSKDHWTAKSWDRSLFVKPFSEVVLDFGGPFVVTKNISSKGLDELVKELHGVLNGNQTRCAMEHTS